MRATVRSTLWLLGALACGPAGSTPTPAPRVLALPDSVAVLDAASGRRVGAAELSRRVAAADLVLLGELHDNPTHHLVRGRLIAALADRKPAIVFEQFAKSEQPIDPPAAGEALETWLDRNGFDRRGWNWPLHRPVVEAALAHGRALLGTGLSRESLRSVVRGGVAAAPAPLRELIERVPMDSVARTEVDRELIEGHCGQLPPSMLPGMRAAQEARDASMTEALLAAVASGPAWLIAGNGHVRADMGVPRMLRVLAPDRTMLVVGFLERTADGAMPAPGDRRPYDLVVVTPPATREDPCAGFTRPK